MDEKKILIIDGDDMLGRLLEKVFCRSGYCVRLALGAKEALEILRNEYFHVIFIDLGLIKTKEFDFFKLIRNLSPSAFIYALSGEVEYSSPPENHGTGFHDHFAKIHSLTTVYKMTKNLFENTTIDFKAARIGYATSYLNNRVVQGDHA